MVDVGKLIPRVEKRVRRDSLQTSFLISIRFLSAETQTPGRTSCALESRRSSTTQARAKRGSVAAATCARVRPGPPSVPDKPASARSMVRQHDATPKCKWSQINRPFKTIHYRAARPCYQSCFGLGRRRGLQGFRLARVVRRGLQLQRGTRHLRVDKIVYPPPQKKRRKK